MLSWLPSLSLPGGMLSSSGATHADHFIHLLAAQARSAKPALKRALHDTPTQSALATEHLRVLAPKQRVESSDRLFVGLIKLDRLPRQSSFVVTRALRHRRCG